MAAFCDYKYNEVRRSTDIKVCATVFEGDYVDEVYVRGSILEDDVCMQFPLGTTDGDIDKAFNAKLKTYPGHTPIPEQT